MDKNIITVNIFGSDYTIKGVAEPDYMLKIAAFINSRMNEIHDATGIKDPKKIAILAAINITDELFEVKKSLKEAVPPEQLALIRNRVETLIGMVDSVLPASTVEIPLVDFKPAPEASHAESSSDPEVSGDETPKPPDDPEKEPE